MTSETMRLRQELMAEVFAHADAIAELRQHAVNIFWAPPGQRAAAADALHAVVAALPASIRHPQADAAPRLAQVAVDWGMRQVPDPIQAAIGAPSGPAHTLRTQIGAFMTDPAAVAAASDAADDLATATGFDADALYNAALVAERRRRWNATLDASPQLRLRPTLAEGVLATPDGRFVASPLSNGAGWVLEQTAGTGREYLLDVDGCQLAVLRADL